MQPPSALVCTLLIKSSAMACGQAQCRHPRLSLRMHGEGLLWSTAQQRYCSVVGRRLCLRRLLVAAASPVILDYALEIRIVANDRYVTSGER